MIYFRYETYNHEQRILNEDLLDIKNNVEIIRRKYEGPFVLVTGDSWSAGEWDIDKGLNCFTICSTLLSIKSSNDSK